MGWNDRLGILENSLVESIDNIEDFDPERLSEKTRKGCDSLTSIEISRGRSEEVSPPRDRS